MKTATWKRWRWRSWPAPGSAGSGGSASSRQRRRFSAACAALPGGRKRPAAARRRQHGESASRRNNGVAAANSGVNSNTLRRRRCLALYLNAKLAHESSGVALETVIYYYLPLCSGWLALWSPVEWRHVDLMEAVTGKGQPETFICLPARKHVIEHDFSDVRNSGRQMKYSISMETSQCVCINMGRGGMEKKKKKRRKKSLQRHSLLGMTILHRHGKCVCVSKHDWKAVNLPLTPSGSSLPVTC